MRRMITPSTLKQTIACPPSAVLSRDAPFTQGLAAIYGTILHRTAERVLKGIIPTANADIGYTEKSMSLDKPGARMAQSYVDDIRSLGGRIWVEQRMDFSLQFGLPVKSAVGLCDCIVYTPDETLWSIDLKTGTYKQDPAPGGNAWPQTATYGMGAYNRFKWALPIKRIKQVIWQGRKTYEHLSSPSDLERWRIQVTNLSAHVYRLAEAHDSGQGIGRENFKPSLENCRFCNAVACPFRA